MKKVGILYVCIGRYTIFWKDFYTSCERYFYAGEQYEKRYYVFTDADHIAYEDSERVQKFGVSSCAWPYPTLYRFAFFQTAKAELEKMDYLYFFNANCLFIKPTSEELAPTPQRPLVMVQHPNAVNKSPSSFSYEANPSSLAYIGKGQGKHYCWGALNGGQSKAYLDMVEKLDQCIKEDERKGIVAVWHDESHLNRYLVDHEDKVKIAPAPFLYPQEIMKPEVDAHIITRDKKRYGGHDFMRKKGHNLYKIIRGILWRKWLPSPYDRDR